MLEGGEEKAKGCIQIFMNQSYPTLGVILRSAGQTPWRHLQVSSNQVYYNNSQKTRFYIRETNNAVFDAIHSDDFQTRFPFMHLK